MRLRRNKGEGWGPFLVGIAILIVIIFVVNGPAGCSRQIDSWKASSLGADWLVVQYSQDGRVINYWKLENSSVGNEKESDGIYFTDGDGNVVHLSGHYVYVQVKDSSWEKTMKTFVENKK